ncbi:hypothetical protein SSX86_017095 [Deinandra increscens subsp. villosa]|uniref:Expansin n=1 Tax=Deinandra increscens subsp. villosa TaxID=3103831 RepID=A0AAP0GY73_9ASTR
MASSLNVFISGFWLLFFISPYSCTNVVEHVSRTKQLSHPKHPKHPKQPEPALGPGVWKNARATFYGSGDGTEGMGGACGYDEVKPKGYGVHNTALSPTLFNNGLTCGACYEIKCVNNHLCKPGCPRLIVTATNLCASNGDWCSPPNEHFDLSQPAFLQIAEQKAGVTPIQYRRVPCLKQGGTRFTITGNPYYTMVLVWNVGGAGDVTCLEVKGHEGAWNAMRRDWGQKWVTNVVLVHQSLSFRVRVSDGRAITSMNVAPRNWQFGQTFEGTNFK